MADEEKDRDLQVNFRIPAKLKAELEASAGRFNRTLTAELVHRLQLGLEGSKRIDDLRLLGGHLRLEIDRIIRPLSPLTPAERQSIRAAIAALDILRVIAKEGSVEAETVAALREAFTDPEDIFVSLSQRLQYTAARLTERMMLVERRNAFEAELERLTRKYGSLDPLFSRQPIVDLDEKK